MQIRFVGIAGWLNLERVTEMRAWNWFINLAVWSSIARHWKVAVAIVCVIILLGWFYFTVPGLNCGLLILITAALVLFAVIGDEISRNLSLIWDFLKKVSNDLVTLGFGKRTQWSFVILVVGVLVGLVWAVQPEQLYYQAQVDALNTGLFSTTGGRLIGIGVSVIVFLIIVALTSRLFNPTPGGVRRSGLSLGTLLFWGVGVVSVLWLLFASRTSITLILGSLLGQSFLLDLSRRYGLLAPVAIWGPVVLLPIVIWLIVFIGRISKWLLLIPFAIGAYNLCFLITLSTATGSESITTMISGILSWIQATFSR